MTFRELKGRQIVERANVTRNGNLRLVPSRSGKGKLIQPMYELNLKPRFWSEGA